MTIDDERPPSYDEGNHETTPLLGSGVGAGDGPSAKAPHERATSGDGGAASAAAAAADDAQIDRWRDDRPLPVGQILLLCYVRMIEPVAYFSIFPFINQMIEKDGGVPTTDVGFYSGLIESLFSLTQMMLMIFWGRAADRFGRKPVLVVAMTGLTLMTSIFGFATSLTEMILFRCLAGACGGTIVTIRTMISEHSTARTQARAFSWFALANNIGLFVGPLLGGALADPATQYGGFFREHAFFTDYPFALPSLATGLFSAVATIVAFLFVKETRPPKSGNRDRTTSSSSPPSTPADPSANVSDSPPSSTMELLRAPGVAMVLFLYSHVMLLAYAYTAVSPVFWFEPVPLGGFGFSELQISLFMAVTGASQALWLLVVFPPLQRRRGTGFVLRLCASCYPFFFLVNPFLNLLLRQNTDAARLVFWIGGTSTLCLGVGVSMAFTAVQLALNDVSPSSATLGTLNALALALVSGVRAFAPVLFTSIFAWGIRDQILDGYLVWVFLFVAAAGFTVATQYLPKNAEGKIPEEVEGE